MSGAKVHHVVCTSGVSALGQQNVYGAAARSFEGFSWKGMTASPAGAHSDATARESWLKRLRENPVRWEASPKSVSAEFSLLHALDSAGRLAKGFRFVLIHTDTLGGRVAADSVADVVWRAYGVEAKLKEVTGLDVGNPVALRRGLGSFMEMVARELDGQEPTVTCFAPVGGFKVMTSLGYLAGAYLGFPTAYLHEDSQVLHTIPAVPIRMSQGALRDVANAVRATRETIAWDALTSEQQRQVGDSPFLFERVDDLVSRNAFAEFLVRRPELRGILGPPVWVGHAVRASVENDRSERDFILQQSAVLHDKLLASADDADLRHDLTFKSLKGSTVSLFKGASNGKLVYRAGYRFDASTGALWLHRIWTDHDAYERDASKGQRFFDDLAAVQWDDWSEQVHAARGG